MGRYANFSTGYEYKFVFAIQDSEDILAFGGCKSLRNSSIVRWSAAEDLTIVRETLEVGGLPVPDPAAYEKPWMDCMITERMHV